MRKLGKGIAAGALLLMGVSALTQTAFAQTVPPPVGETAEPQEILGQTREQLVRRLGREKKGSPKESLWEIDREPQEYTLWVVYGSDQRAVFCRYSVEGKTVLQERKVPEHTF